MALEHSLNMPIGGRSIEHSGRCRGSVEHATLIGVGAVSFNDMQT